jgi:uncharacterized protein (DUF305 family)
MKHTNVTPATQLIQAFIIATLLAGCEENKKPAMKNDNTHTGMNRSNDQNPMPMDAMSHKVMMDDLNTKTGDEFDKAFLAMMIQHHRQALEMSERAKRVAKHDELKKFADDIIVAQSKEIDQMRQWHKQWGYGE